MAKLPPAKSTYMVNIYDDPDAKGASVSPSSRRAFEGPKPKENRFTGLCLSILCPFRATGAKRRSTGLSLRQIGQRGTSWNGSSGTARLLGPNG